jgi:hypothetical protein
MTDRRTPRDDIRAFVIAAEIAAIRGRPASNETVKLIGEKLIESRDPSGATDGGRTGGVQTGPPSADPSSKE